MDALRTGEKGKQARQVSDLLASADPGVRDQSPWCCRSATLPSADATTTTITTTTTTTRVERASAEGPVRRYVNDQALYGETSSTKLSSCCCSPARVARIPPSTPPPGENPGVSPLIAQGRRCAGSRPSLARLHVDTGPAAWPLVAPRVRTAWSSAFPRALPPMDPFASVLERPTGSAVTL